MPLKPFYTIAELAKLSGMTEYVIRGMLAHHKVELTEMAAGKRPRKVVMVAAIKDAMPDLFRSLMVSTTVITKN